MTEEYVFYANRSNRLPPLFLVPKHPDWLATGNQLHSFSDCGLSFRKLILYFQNGYLINTPYFDG